MIPSIKIYTDGSCHTQLAIGAWVTIIVNDHTKQVLSGLESNTTHHRMELIAVINGIEWLIKQGLQFHSVDVITDSQYVVGLIERKNKIEAKDYLTKAGNPIRNKDIVFQFFSFIEQIQISFCKIKAHQALTNENRYNIEADKLSRQLVREAVYK
jgi:ribonuclease HI